jgi:hypothetical protein
VATFYLRVGGGNGYVKGLADGRFCTWQASVVATTALLERGFRHGARLPDWLFYSLLRQGHLYTGGSGPGPEAPLSIQEPPGCGCNSCLVILGILGSGAAAAMVVLIGFIN